jgi:RNA polymerase sigma factor (sigma-70 family)
MDMATGPMSEVIQHLRRSELLRPGAGLTDGQLLEDYVGHRNEAALAALLLRHGPMVWGVCRRILRHHQDAEDAFQATFLVLLRKAASITARELLANWLYGVAHQTARKARARAARRMERERQVVDMPEPAVGEHDLQEDLRPVLDMGLSRLPDKYRCVVVLCDLEGKTRKEAAGELGVPEGTVAGRLARARVLLARRLARCGLALPGTALATLLAQQAASASVPTALVSATIQSANLWGTGQTAASAALSVDVVALTEGVLQAMVLNKMKNIIRILIVGCLIVLGVGVLGYHRAPGKPEEQPARQPGLPSGRSLPPEVVGRLGVRTTEALSRGGERPTLRHAGMLSVDNDRVVNMRNDWTGEVTQVAEIKDGDMTRPLRSGDKVQKGQVLAVVWSRIQADRKAELVDALVKLHFSKDVLKRLQQGQLIGGGTDLINSEKEVQASQKAVTSVIRGLVALKISEEDIKSLQQEGEQIARNPETRDPVREMARWGRVEIRAPAAGVVIDKRVHLGDTVPEGAFLFTITDLSRLQVSVAVPVANGGFLMELPLEKRHWLIHAGGAAPIPGTFTVGRKVGPMDSVAFHLEKNEPSKDLRDFLLTGYVDNTQGRLTVGQTVSVVLTPPDGEAARPAAALPEVTVPLSALVEQSGVTYVLVQPDLKKPVFEERRVLVVRRGSDVVHLRAVLKPEEERQGFQVLRPGENVVTTAATELKATLDDGKNEDRR